MNKCTHTLMGYLSPAMKRGGGERGFQGMRYSKMCVQSLDMCVEFVFVNARLLGLELELS